MAAQLGRIVGPDRVITSASELARLGSDALGRSRGLRDLEILDRRPDVAVRPIAVEEIVEIVRWARAERCPVVPVGGGSGLMGGARAIHGGVLLDLTGMGQIQSIEHENRSVTVQAGATLGKVDAAIRSEGRMLGHDPWTLNVATVGGVISTNGLGYRGGRFGPMRSQVLGLTVVLPTAQVLRTPPVPTHSTGPDLTHLFVGAEGTLGVIVEATLKTYPAPAAASLAAYGFPDFETGFRAILRIAELDLDPSLLEYGEDLPEPAAELYLGFEGHPEAVKESAHLAAVACEQNHGERLAEEIVHTFWQERHRYGDRYGEVRRAGSSWRPPRLFDFVHVAVPASRVLEYRGRCLERFAGGDIRVGDFGLWTGPDLVSLVLWCDPGRGRTGQKRLADAVDWSVHLAQELGGSMEYCHGVGIRLASALPDELGPGLDVLRGVKAALDPDGIMNPGKLGL